MPNRIFTALERDKFDHFPEEITSEELNTYFRLSLADLEQVRDLRGNTNQFGFALQLCSLRYLGFCPDQVLEIPLAVRLYVAQQLEFELADLEDYGTREQTRTDHLKRAQLYLGFRLFKEAESEKLLEWLVERALEHDNPITLFVLSLEKLKVEKLVRPGITVLERLVLSAREKAQQRIYELVAPALSADRLNFLDSLLLKDQALKLTRLEWLRQEPVTNSPTSILKTLARLEYFREVGVTRWEFNSLNPNRRKQLAALARRTSSQALASAPPQRRYPLLVAFVLEALVELTDLVVEMFEAYLSGVYSRAGRELRQFQLGIAGASNQKLYLLTEMGDLILNEDIPDVALRKNIFEKVAPEKLKKELEECQKLIRPLDDNYFDFLAERYSHIREFAPKFLETLKFHSNLANRPLLEGLELLRKLNRENKRQVPGNAPLAFVSGRWEPYLYNPNGSLNRKYYELCLLWELKEALRGGNIWVEGSRRYAPLDTYQIPPTRWPERKGEVYEMLGLPVDGAVRLKELETEILEGLGRLGKLMPGGETSKVWLEEGKLHLGRDEGLALPASTLKLRKLVGQKLPLVELVEVVMEVDHWLKFSQHLTHAQDGEVCRAEQLPQLYAALLAQACNLGLANMSRMSGFSFSELSWLTNWYLRDETLKEATTSLVNYQHTLPLARHWGDGTFSSSDGQRFTVTVPSRSAVALPRYFGFGKGLTMLNWTSDLYAQYGSKPVKSTNREALHTLDAILDNESDLLLAEHTTDTAGFTEILCGLFDLLGLKFSPRLRDISDQRLWRTAGVVVPPVLQSLFKGNLVRSNRILEQWDELARLAGSLKLGYTSASLLISKLQAFPRKNALASTLQEYGRLVKTAFLLNYLENGVITMFRVKATLRKKITNF